MTYVIKVNYGGILRRITCESQPGSEDGMQFPGLAARIRELFEIPALAQLNVTYRDRDDDLVTMSNTLDLKDACVFQSLNPLRLNVVLSSAPIPQGVSVSDPSSSMIPHVWTQVFNNASSKPGLDQFAIVGIAALAHIPEAVETITKLIASKPSAVSNSEVAHGALPASAAAAPAAGSLPAGKVTEAKQDPEADWPSQSNDYVDSREIDDHFCDACLELVKSEHAAPYDPTDNTTFESTPPYRHLPSGSKKGSSTATSLKPAREPIASDGKAVRVNAEKNEAESVESASPSSRCGIAMDSFGTPLRQPSVTPKEETASSPGSFIDRNTGLPAFNEGQVLPASEEAGSGAGQLATVDLEDDAAGPSSVAPTNGAPDVASPTDKHRWGIPERRALEPEESCGCADAGDGDVSLAKGYLEKLETMGFTDSELNIELLKRNHMDLQKTLDDLCGANKWKPILEEVEDLGFSDRELNIRLMFKNNGNPKRMVKDMVQMYRDAYLELQQRKRWV